MLGYNHAPFELVTTRFLSPLMAKPGAWDCTAAVNVVVSSGSNCSYEEVNSSINGAVMQLRNGHGTRLYGGILHQGVTRSTPPNVFRTPHLADAVVNILVLGNGGVRCVIESTFGRPSHGNDINSGESICHVTTFAPTAM